MMKSLKGKKNSIWNSYFLIFLLVTIGLLMAMPAIAADVDGDGIDDSVDNCPSVSNFLQTDTDGDGRGDACDLDDDNDGLLDSEEDLDNSQTVDLGETDPLDADTDDDGYDDGMEVTHSSNPLDDGSVPAHGNPMLNACLADASQDHAIFSGAPIDHISLQTKIRDFDDYINQLTNYHDRLVFSEGLLVQIDHEPNTLTTDLRDFTAESSITGLSSVTINNSMQEVVAVVTHNGEVELWDINATNEGWIWAADTKRGGCSDSLSAPPTIHLRRYASDAFKSKYTTDLVYVGTRFSSGCSGGGEDNQVIAFRADTGAVEWAFNGSQTSDVDVIYGGLTLDETSDLLYVPSDRNDPTQDSLWAIDVVTGTLAWSVNVGPVWTTPFMLGDRLYVLTTAGSIRALDKATGTTLWAASNGGDPFVDDGAIIETPAGEVFIVGINYKGGIFLVRDDGLFATSLPITLPVGVAAIPGAILPGLGAENLFIGADDGRIYQLDLVTGTVETSRLVAEGSRITELVMQEDNSSSRAPSLFAATDDGQVHRYCQPFRTNTSPIDTDGDGVTDGADNCPNDANARQIDADQDGIGDACDPYHRFHFKVGGILSGLASGASVVLQNNGTNDLVMDANGAFNFLELQNLASYDVTVLTQPTMPNQVCHVSNGSGSVDGGDVTTVDIQCTTTVTDTQMSLMLNHAKAKLNFETPHADVVRVQGEFWLDSASDDIVIGTKNNGRRVIAEPVTVRLAGRPEFEQTFPAGFLRESNTIPHRYARKMTDPAGPVVKLIIDYVAGAYHGTFDARWKKRDLQALPTPTVEDDVIASDPALASPEAVPFDLDIGNDDGVETGINFSLTKDNVRKRVYKFEQVPPDTIWGIPSALNFRAGGFVDEILIEVDTSWLGDPTWFLDVEITGLNGGPAHHGTQRLAVVDGAVFFAGPVSSEVVFDWTTDITPQSVNEVYTTCVQVVHHVNGQDTLVGGQKCVDSGPF